MWLLLAIEHWSALMQFWRRIVPLVFLLLIGAPSVLRAQLAVVPPPGKLDNVYTQGAISFHYPQNWQVLDKKGEGDVLIGPPEAVYHWRLRQNRKVGVSGNISHGLLWGYYEPNFPTIEGAADELLGRFHQRFGSLWYRADADAKVQANGRPALFRGVMIFPQIPVLSAEANGILFLIQDGGRVWYWLTFFLSGDTQQYTPTLAALLGSISIGGKGLDIAEFVDVQRALPKETLSASEIAKRSLPSVVMLTMQDSHGQPIKLGSGFLVQNGLIVTNFHVIEGAQQGYVRLVGQDARYSVIGVVAANEDNDLALLSIAQAANAPPLQLTQEPGPVVGDTVYVIGNPEGLEGTFSQGIVSSIRGSRERALIQITAPISAGSSGGPVLDNKGAVIGVAVGMIEAGQNLNFAIPVSSVADLLSRTGPIVLLPEFSHGRSWK